MYGEVLCEDENQTAVDGAAASHHTVARELLFLHAEVVAAVLLEHIIFLERSFVEQHVDTLAGSVFAALVLLLNGFLAAAQTGFLAVLNQFLDFLKLCAHCYNSYNSLKS